MDFWSERPEHIIEEIAENIHNPRDFINFGAVCKLWRSVFCGNFHHLCPLVLLSHENGEETHEFFRFAQEKDLVKISNRFDFPEIRNNKIFGSSRGWLLTTGPSSEEVNLLNPFTRVRIPLPYLSCLSRGYTQFYRVAVSSDPTSNKHDCTIMVLDTNQRGLYFCTIGDDKWTINSYFPAFCLDVISYNGLFYIVNNDHVLFVIDLKTEFPQINNLAQFETYERWGEGVERWTYLVESSGEILLLVATEEHEEYASFEVGFEFAGFKVYKLVEGEPSDNHLKFYHTPGRGRTNYPSKFKYIWERVRDIGNHVLFIGDKGSLISLDLFVHKGFKRNCIYFTEEDEKVYEFNLEDESLEVVSLDSKEFSAIWLSPNPQ